MSTPISPQLQAGHATAEALLAQRDEVDGSLRQLSQELSALGRQLSEAENMLDAADKDIRNEGRPAAITRRSLARERIKTLEREIEAVDKKLGAASRRAVAIDEQLSAAIADYLLEFNDHRKQETEAQQAELETLVITSIKPFLMRAHAFAAAYGGHCGHLKKLCIPNLLDGSDVVRGDFDVWMPGSPQVRLADAWREDPELVAMSDVRRACYRTARRLTAERDRIACERQERIEADPDLKATQLRDQQTIRSQESAERAAKIKAWEEQRERDAAERSARVDERQRQFGPGGAAYHTLPVHRPQDGMDPVRAAAAQAERMATGS